MTLLPLQKLRAVSKYSLSAVINVDDLSAFVSEWRGKNREWSKIITDHYMKR